MTRLRVYRRANHPMDYWPWHIELSAEQLSPMTVGRFRTHAEALAYAFNYVDTFERPSPAWKRTR